jgi:hypothetical protein
MPARRVAATADVLAPYANSRLTPTEQSAGPGNECFSSFIAGRYLSRAGVGIQGQAHWHALEKTILAHLHRGAPLDLADEDKVDPRQMLKAFFVTKRQYPLQQGAPRASPTTRCTVLGRR